MKKSKYKLYYKGKKVKIVLPKENLVDCGTEGDVYYYKDGCIKIFKCKISDSSASVLQTIKVIRDPNLYCIHNLYYDSKALTAHVKAYDNNFHDLCKLAERLSLYKIIVNDLHEKSVIMQRNRLIVIDADRWFKCDTFNYDYLVSENYRAIVHLLMRLYYRELVNFGKIEPLENNIYDKVLENLESIKAQKIFQELSGYKYPIDYIEAKVKKLR